MFARLARALDRLDLVADSRFTSTHARAANRQAIDQIVENWTRQHPLADLVRLLDEAEVPSSPIYSIADAVKDPQYQARGTLLTVEHPRVGRMQMPAVIPRLSETPGGVISLGPELGEDTEAVLGGLLGYTAERLASLREQGVV